MPGGLQGRTCRLEAANRLAVSFAVVLSLWAVARISSDLQRLQPVLAEVVQQDKPDVERLIAGVDSATVPLLLTFAIGVVLPVDEILAGEPEVAIIQTA